jgi:hypothetical protein
MVALDVHGTSLHAWWAGGSRLVGHVCQTERTIGPRLLRRIYDLSYFAIISCNFSSWRARWNFCMKSFCSIPLSLDIPGPDWPASPSAGQAQLGVSRLQFLLSLGVKFIGGQVSFLTFGVVGFFCLLASALTFYKSAPQVKSHDQQPILV